jgi:hypothetical protein
MPSKLEDCDCGFIDSSDPTKGIFTSFLVVNFSSIKSKQFNDLFIPAKYEIGRANSPYTRNFLADQVQLSEAGLDLTVLPSDSNVVSCGQVFSRAVTFFYGSYHAQIRVGHVPGTVTAFFNYKNDSSEVDIEYLSAWDDDPTLLYSVKPQVYLDKGVPSNSTYQQETWNDTSVPFDQDFHDWSFVWLPDIVYFGLDAKYSRFLTTNVPQAPGHLALSHWSDGNPDYSQGPPTQSTTVTIQSLWAIYNDTNAGAFTCKMATSACTITNGIFQASTASATLPSATIINSAHFISPAAPSWLFVLLIVFLLV